MKLDANGKPIADEPPNIKLIDWANRRLFEKYCKAEGVDPAGMASPMLRKIIADQNAARAAIDEPEKK